jgi:transposase
MKVVAVLLYVSGLSMNRTAKLLGVSTPTIQAWLEQFAAAYAQKPEPEGRAVVIELDEIWHYLKKSRSRSGSGRLGIVLQANWWTGSAAVVTKPPASA